MGQSLASRPISGNTGFATLAGNSSPNSPDLSMYRGFTTPLPPTPPPIVRPPLIRVPSVLGYKGSAIRVPSVLGYKGSAIMSGMPPMAATGFRRAVL